MTRLPLILAFGTAVAVARCDDGHRGSSTRKEAVREADRRRPTEASSASEPSLDAGRQMTVVGTLTWIDLEGGFWAVVTPDGRRLRPIGLEEHLKGLREGRKLRFEGRAEPRSLGVQMWGEAFRVTGASWLEEDGGADGGAPR